MADQSKKRRPPSDGGPNAKRQRFPMRPQHQIHAQPTKSAYPNGEINVKNFLKSHENEIKSLEHAMRSAKKGLSRRAFQDVPRELRRRTASHNPQRVPKRLRVRAKQEANEDNTPIVKGKSGSGVGKGGKGYLRKEGREKSRQQGKQRAKRAVGDADGAPTDKMDVDEGAGIAKAAKKSKTADSKPKSRFPPLATPATPASRFRRRQKDKTWLPTHIWHSKRARMTDPRAPLWRFAMPLQPLMKAYRLTHRAVSQRGAVAWDTSYMSTISLEGVEASIASMLKGLHFAEDTKEDPWQEKGRAKKWKHGTRAWEGWLYEREAKPLRPIARVTILWCMPEAGSKKRKAFIRVHPSAFLQLWNEVIRISKVQRPGVIVEDLRFEIGSIEIMGPAAAETLCSILSPNPDANAVDNTPQSIWATLASVNDVGSLPLGAILAFTISDPRFRDPPTTAPLQQDQDSLNSLMDTLSQWPPDDSQSSSTLFDRNSRLAAQRSMPSQKSINRRKSECTLGEELEVKDTDPRIPMVLYVSREHKSWTILLPWKCVPPVWRGISRYPLSTGGNPRFGGLKERRQVNYERSVPLFPFDHPGTDAGWAWEFRERGVRKHEWTKRPKGKRIEWSTIDLGNGKKGEIGDPWSCDWETLFSKQAEKAQAEQDVLDAKSPCRQLDSQQAKNLVGGNVAAAEYLSQPYVFAAKISMIQRGVPTDCARIYRLPTNNNELREKWMLQMPKADERRQPRRQHSSYFSDAPEHIKRRDLARSLIEPQVRTNEPPKAGEEGYPGVPDEDDLIGFVTTGNFNLAEGMPTAIANLSLHRLLANDVVGQGMPKSDRVCIVRPAGSTIGRLATWEVV